MRRRRRAGRLAAVGGVLQALKIRGIDHFDTRNHTRGRIAPGQTLQVEWVTIDEPDMEDCGLAADLVFCQAESKGAAQFARIEECWYAGGPNEPRDAVGSPMAGGGQVWQYVPAREQLTLVLEPPRFAPLKRPRNICLSSGGGIVFSEAGRGANYLRGLTQTGEVFDLIRNDRNDSPWVAACFSPQRRTLFVNIQGETQPAGKADPAKGMTFAIWGPWESGAL